MCVRERDGDSERRRGWGIRIRVRDTSSLFNQYPPIKHQFHTIAFLLEKNMTSFKIGAKKTERQRKKPQIQALVIKLTTMIQYIYIKFNTKRHQTIPKLLFGNH